MNTLLLLSLSLSAPPAELPISVRAELAVKQAMTRITQNTPVRAPTSSLLVPSRKENNPPPMTQPTGVSSQGFFVKAPHGEGQTTGITQVTPVQTAVIRHTQPMSLGVTQAGGIPTHAPNVVRLGITKTNSGCTTG